jgi:hypothetical protein
MAIVTANADSISSLYIIDIHTKNRSNCQEKYKYNQRIIMRFTRYLTEASRPGKFIVTIKDLKKLEMYSLLTREAKRNIETAVDLWFKDKDNRKSIAELLKWISQEGTKAIKKLGDVPYYDKRTLMLSFFDMDELFFKEKDSDLWPIPIYISSSPQDRMTIGIMVHQNGKKEMFEGNDEATAETYELVDEVLGNIKPVTVFAQHGEETVNKIRKTNTLPKDLYVSPSKKYAEGYWSLEENRVMFSCEAMSNAFRKESEVDWKTKNATKIKKFKYM